MRSRGEETDIMVFSGNAHPRLARQVADHLNIGLGKALIDKFSDGEINVEILQNVRGKDVFVIQPTSAPTNNHLFELILMADALKRASVGRVTAVMPYFGYARQDRRVRSARVPISAKVIANMLSGVGVDRVLTVDLHADQIQGFFDFPVDNVYGSPLLVSDIWRQSYQDLIVVSPDVGGVVRARAVAKALENAELAIIDKRRAKANEAEVMHIIGDVHDQTCVLIDDMVDTAGTLCQGAAALKQHGAVKVVAYATHAVLSGNAIRNIEASELDEVVVSDTIPLNEAARGCQRIRQLSVGRMLAETIRRIHTEESVSTLYMD